MGKEGVLKIIFIILILSIFIMGVYAEETTEEKVKKAYDWLGTNARTSNNWNGLNIQQHAFLLLALNSNETYVKKGNESLYNKSYLGAGIRCFGTGPGRAVGNNCRLYETALAKIALNKIEENTTLIKNWFANREILFNEINWFLELDIARDKTANCSIGYEGGIANITINENKNLSNLRHSGKSCFALYQNYWLSIKKECYNESFKVNCKVSDETEIFRVSLKYKTSSESPIWYVSSQSNDVASNTEWEFEVQSYCLANVGSNTCDYEGTAWGAYSLKNEDESEKLVPYLMIKKEFNKNLLPSALIYIISQKYGNEVERLQRQQGFWMAENTLRGQFYDTALAGVAAGVAGLGNLDNARNYLIRNVKESQDKKYRYWKCSETGCNDIRDTAFLLFILWPEFAPIGISNNDCISQGADYKCKDSCITGEEIPFDYLCSAGQVCCKLAGTSETGTEACESEGGICKTACSDDENPLDVACPSDSQYCCKPISLAETCSDVLGGEECESWQRCNGENETIASGILCCVGECVDANAETKTCSEIGNKCSSDEICIDTDSWNVIDFIETTDSEKCCSEDAKCVQNKRCSAIGKECARDESCTGSTEETKDVENCCVGECKSTSTQEEKKSLLWLWISLIAVILILVVFYFLKFRRKKPKKEEKDFFGLGSEMPRTRPSPSMPSRIPSRPMPRMTMQPRTASANKNDELEKTLNKLKNMTKK